MMERCCGTTEEDDKEGAGLASLMSSMSVVLSSIMLAYTKKGLKNGLTIVLIIVFASSVYSLLLGESKEAAKAPTCGSGKATVQQQTIQQQPVESPTRNDVEPLYTGGYHRAFADTSL